MILTVGSAFLLPSPVQMRAVANDRPFCRKRPLKRRAANWTHKGRSNTLIERRNNPKTGHTFQSDAPGIRLAISSITCIYCLDLSSHRRMTSNVLDMHGREFR